MPYGYSGYLDQLIPAIFDQSFKVKEDSPKAHHFTRQSLWKVNVERKVVHGDFDQWQKDMPNLGWSVSSGMSWSRQPEFPRI